MLFFENQFFQQQLVKRIFRTLDHARQNKCKSKGGNKDTSTAEAILIAEGGGETGGGASPDDEGVADDDGAVDNTGGGISIGGIELGNLLWCIIPAILLLLAGGAMELVRWMNSRQG